MMMLYALEIYRFFFYWSLNKFEERWLSICSGKKKKNKLVTTPYRRTRSWLSQDSTLAKHHFSSCYQGLPLWLSWYRICLQWRETWVQYLGWEDPLEKGRALHSILWPGEFHGLYSPWDCKVPGMTGQLSLHYCHWATPKEVTAVE